MAELFNITTRAAVPPAPTSIQALCCALDDDMGRTELVALSIDTLVVGMEGILPAGCRSLEIIQELASRLAEDCRRHHVRLDAIMAELRAGGLA